MLVVHIYSSVDSDTRESELLLVGARNKPDYRAYPLRACLVLVYLREFNGFILQKIVDRLFIKLDLEEIILR
jgi:hypothetical protein